MDQSTAKEEDEGRQRVVTPWAIAIGATLVGVGALAWAFLDRPSSGHAKDALFRLKSSAELSGWAAGVADPSACNRLLIDELSASVNGGRFDHSERCLSGLLALKRSGRSQDNVQSEITRISALVKSRKGRAFLAWVLLNYFGDVGQLDDYCDLVDGSDEGFLAKTIVYTISGSGNLLNPADLASLRRNGPKKLKTLVEECLKAMQYDAAIDGWR